MTRIRAGATASEFNMSARPWTAKMRVPLLWESQYSTDNSASEARTDISGVATALTVTNLQHDTATIAGSATISTRFLRLDVKSSEEPKGSKSALACTLRLLTMTMMMAKMTTALMLSLVMSMKLMKISKLDSPSQKAKSAVITNRNAEMLDAAGIARYPPIWALCYLVIWNCFAIEINKYCMDLRRACFNHNVANS